MDHALWLLLGLRIRAWFRRIRRALSTVKGLLVTVLGAMLVTAWLVPIFVFTPPPTADHLNNVREFGPLALLFFCLLNYFFSSGERVLAFSPAEVNLLFPAPFSRRQLLLYKITAMSGGAILLGLFMALMLRQHTSGLLTGAIGITLATLLLQYFALVLALLASLIGAAAYSRQRKIVLLVLLILLAAGTWRQGLATFQEDWLEAYHRIMEIPGLNMLLAPFGWPIKAMTAETLWPDLLQWTGLSLLTNAVLIGIIFSLDAHYLETSAAASEKIYHLQQKVRRSGMAGAGMPVGEKARWTLPSLPRWGGVGPLAWRQLLASLRGFWWMVTMLIFLSAFLIPILVGKNRAQPINNEQVMALVGSLFFSVCLFVPTLITFDFRADIDRIEVLKTLPLPAWRIVVGQLLTPVLLISLLQILFLVILQIILGEFQPLLPAFIPFILSVNFFVFAIENLIFLWFPTRQMGATPGDLQNFGRVMLLYLAKIVLLLVVFTIAFLMGLLVYFLAGQSLLAGGITVWVFLTAGALALIPLVALAFQRFDVSADTPP